MNRIKEADVIIYAGSLVNPALLSYAKADCKIYNSAHMTLDAVVDVMREAEAAGKGTVRLHTGDPSVYGAIREQMDLLDEYGIAYDVCPGVSAVFGAAASLACEYTLPDVTQTLILTRAEGKTPVPEKEKSAKSGCTPRQSGAVSVVRACPKGAAGFAAWWIRGGHAGCCRV
mgnify:CR=1 FL=1